MCNLDEPDIPLTGGASDVPASNEPGGTESRLKELERENARLRAELAEARQDVRSLQRTLQTVAPEYVVTEAEMREVMAHPVPFAEAVKEAERMLRANNGQ
jgi:chromosome segregation ATPase